MDLATQEAETRTRIRESLLGSVRMTARGGDRDAAADILEVASRHGVRYEMAEAGALANDVTRLSGDVVGLERHGIIGPDQASAMHARYRRIPARAPTGGEQDGR